MMKNDIGYEYRVFTNRIFDVESMEVGICTSKNIKEIKPKDKVNGRFFHTSDTDEWYFCWDGELQKLNLKGDSDVTAALAEVKKLIANANAAVSEAKKTAGEAKTAAADAQAAADAANAAVDSIGDKADKSDVEAVSKAVEAKADKDVVDTLSAKVDAIKVPSLDGYATEGFVKDEIEKIDIPDVPVVPTKVSAFENDAEYLTASVADLKYAPIGSDGVDLSDYATKEFVSDEIAKIDIPDMPEIPTKVSAFENDAKYLTVSDLTDYATKSATKKFVEEEIAKIDIPEVPTKVSAFENDANYLTEHQDITGKQDVISDLKDIRANAALGATALQEVPAGYVTETDLSTKGYLTNDSLNDYATKEFVGEEIEKIDIPVVPTKVSAFENDANYLTEHQSLDNYFTKAEVNKMIEDINALIGEAINITNTILA